RAVRLVHMPDDVVRALDPAYAQPDDRTGFADGFPVLVTVAASLAALNAQLARPVAMARFRPNLVIEGAHAFAEDAWRVLKIGELTLRVVK
ncbi:MOSC domain-containing protein, partial [Vibrio parahaemolyticus]